MNTFKASRLLMATACAALATSNLWARNNDASPIPSLDAPAEAINPQTPGAFGSDGQYSVIHASRWTPWDSTPTPQYYGMGYVGPSDTSYASYWTQLDLPNGAMVDRVFAVVYDNDASADWFFDVHGYEGAAFTGSPRYKSFASGSTDVAGQPGYTAIDLTISPPFIIRELADINNDGNKNIVSFNLSLEGKQVDGTDTLRFWGAVVHWSRTISPAPASATFGDVPTDHWAFQQIEALASSSITSGCGGGNFCPDTPVTRAQMAVFLSRALGLHWPQ